MLPGSQQNGGFYDKNRSVISVYESIPLFLIDILTRFL